MGGALFERLRERLDGLKWREFACGWGAAFVNITVTYPVYKIIFRQMLDGISMSRAFGQLRNEGLDYLYRGMLPPLAQKTLSMSVMFGIYEQVRKPLADRNVNLYVAKSIAAMTAGTTECVLMPFERIQTLLADSTYHKKFRNTYDAFRTVGLRYGFREYYRGLVPIFLRNGPSNVLFFVIRDEVQERLPKDRHWVRANVNQFVTGAVIGACLSSFFFPLNVVKVAMQSQLGGPFQNVFVVLGQVYRERGCKLRNIYHGVQWNCLRAFMSWGIMNAAYENIRKLLY